MGAPSEKKRKKQREREKRKRVDRHNQKDPFAVSKEEKDFGRIQIYIVGAISVVAAALIIYALS